MSKYAAAVERRARAICQERCAFMGEPACWQVEDGKLSPHCDEPGCLAMARATLQADEAAGYALVPMKATEGMVMALVNHRSGNYAQDTLKSGIEAAIEAGRIKEE